MPCLRLIVARALALLAADIRGFFAIARSSARARRTELPALPLLRETRVRFPELRVRDLFGRFFGERDLEREGFTVNAGQVSCRAVRPGCLG